MTLLFILLIAPPLLSTILSYTLFLYEESNRTGEPLKNFRKPVLTAIRRSFVNDTMIFWLLFPGLLLTRRWRKPTPGQDLVILVHGLFHNPSAWLHFRRWFKHNDFSTVCLHYSSWRTDFDSVSIRVRQDIESLAAAYPERRIHLVGHSLGGLVLRTVLGQMAHIPESIQTLTTIGTPFNGSKLSPFALSSLGRYLTCNGETVRASAALPWPHGIRGLALYSPTDNLVLPASSLTQTPAGWTTQLTRSVSHPGMLYDRSIFNATLNHIS